MSDRLDKIVSEAVVVIHRRNRGKVTADTIRKAIAEAVKPLVKAIKSHGDYDDGCTCPSCTKVTAALAEFKAAKEAGNG